MRRFALMLMASLSVVALSACSGYGGSAIGGGSTNSPDRLVFQTQQSGSPAVFKVAPSSTTPLIVSVYGSKSSFALTQFDVQASWQTTYSTGTYTDAAPGLLYVQKTCPAIPAGAVNPSGALVVPAAGGYGITPYVAGTFYQTIGILPVAGAPASYCLSVVAITTGGVQGSFTVFVGN